MEEAVRESLATATGSILVTAEAGRAQQTVQRLRAAEADIVLLLLDSSVPAIERAMLIAAIGPLAVELASYTRIGAIDVVAGAEEGDVAAAARFLAAARSTTGQILRVAPEV
ncbi:MAG: hypothetical protein P0Y59_08805 [Candidatus Sphingomonas phytovorans]|nr:hypothetical protein [Sphingomonas sp.]WEK01756.1 MAG: hypothetical protein P0Y59_08805 [Sphingomonas sp.]